jgi:steroid delta-isomerase-like uncharacterized protein
MEVDMPANGTATGLEQPGAATLMRQWFDEVWNKGIAESIDELFPDHAVMWGVGRPETRSQGAAEFKKFYHQMRSACPDVKIELDQVVEQGDTAFARWTAAMTNTGEVAGIPATHKSIKIWGMSACRVHDGKIVEGWNVWDQIGMARQLGMLDGPVASMFP